MGEHSAKLTFDRSRTNQKQPRKQTPAALGRRLLEIIVYDKRHRIGGHVSLNELDTTDVGDWKMSDYKAACAYAASQGWQRPDCQPPGCRSGPPSDRDGLEPSFSQRWEVQQAATSARRNHADTRFSILHRKQLIITFPDNGTNPAGAIADRGTVRPRRKSACSRSFMGSQATATGSLW